MNPQILNAEAAKNLVSGLAQTQKFRRNFDLSRRILCKAGQSQQVQIPIPSEGDFQVLGYNILYSNPAAGAADVLFIRFQNTDSGRSWSNDFLPIRAIATPGAIGNSRFGMREFEAFCPQNDKVTIEYRNDSAEDLTIDVVIFGNVWPKY